MYEPTWNLMHASLTSVVSVLAFLASCFAAKHPCSLYEPTLNLKHASLTPLLSLYSKSQSTWYLKAGYNVPIAHDGLGVVGGGDDGVHSGPVGRIEPGKVLPQGCSLVRILQQGWNIRSTILFHPPPSSCVV